MFKTIQGWWRREEGCQQKPELTLAVTRLMVGMMSIDGNIDDKERQKLAELVSEQFDLPQADCTELIGQAMDDERSDLRIDLVVQQIVDSFSTDDRAAILAKLWRVALADGNIAFLEEQYINRIAALIGVSTSDLAELKTREEKLFPDINRTEQYIPN